MKLTDAIEKRMSIRKYKDKKVDFGDVLEIINSALQTPLAGNISTLKFVIVTEPDTKQKIAEHSDQLWIADADIVVVLCSDISRLKALYDNRAKDYAKQQVGAAIQNFLLRATDLGLASCWVGAFNENEMNSALSIKGDDISIEAILPLGYPAEKPSPKKKAPLENAIFWEKWRQTKKPTLRKDPATC
jgi:nitroreductase